MLIFRIYVILIFIVINLTLKTQEYRILKFRIKSEIFKPAWELVKNVYNKAQSENFNLIILELNTYGGQVDIADSIRTKILTSKIPTYVFINTNAVSAGALIALSCKKIYMREGSVIGAATVLTADGKIAPDKFQSYMRALMRATAEYHGKYKIVQNGDTIEKWIRDPKIAEAMVDSSVYIEGISERGKVLSLTTNEAIKVGFCDGNVESIEKILKLNGIEKYSISEYNPSFIESIVMFFLNPIVQSILLLLIFGGIYYELQTPGFGFPGIIATCAAILYFLPLYLEGLAKHWEILLFIIGLVLIIIEIFVTPGFGLLGIIGLILAIIALILSMTINFSFDFKNVPLVDIFKNFLIVMLSFSLSFILSLFLSGKIFASKKFPKFSLLTEEKKEDGFIGVDIKISKIIGKRGRCLTKLRPSGKIVVDGEIYDAISEEGFLEPDTEIYVVNFLNNEAYVRKINK
ncbi:MAG: nodulation protein NfeD [Bacteroidales bacterium]|nr:nodulation protein NfeD [Bacteroidales bacterium]